MTTKKNITEIGKIVIKVNQKENGDKSVQSNMGGFNDPTDMVMALGSLIKGLLKVGSPDTVETLLKNAWKVGNEMYKKEAQK